MDAAHSAEDRVNRLIHIDRGGGAANTA